MLHAVHACLSDTESSRLLLAFYWDWSVCCSGNERGTMTAAVLIVTLYGVVLSCCLTFLVETITVIVFHKPV